MVKETKYGVISDVHQDPRIVGTAINFLKSKGIEKLLVNGDIGERQDTLENSQNYLAYIVNEIGKSGIESYIQPGSHESVGVYAPVMEYFASKYSNLIDAVKNRKVENSDHHLVFLPGSDWNIQGGEYTFGNGEISTGDYIKTQQGLVFLENFNKYVDLVQRGIAQGILSYQNTNDLKKLVNEPEKTISVCHVPRKFNNIENSVDMAYFAEREDKSLMPGIVVEKMIKEKFGNVSDKELNYIANQNGFTLKRENRGNKDLKKIYEELGITKAVSGHFHESGHRANDLEGNKVPENKFVSELFWNSGHLDAGQTGILIVKGNEVSYQNFNLFK